MKEFKSMDTLCIHAAPQLDKPDARPLVPSICQSTSYVFTSVEDGKLKCEDPIYGDCYTRVSNPTNNALEEKLAAIEGGEAAVSFASGVAAISGVLLMALKTGDHIISDNTLYSASHYIIDSLLRKFGVEITFLDITDLKEVEANIRPNTKVIYCEALANPTMKLADLEGVATICKKHGLLSVVDSTFVTAYCVKPLDLGIDVVIHSTTKYICGHGDAMGGVVIANNEFIRELRDVSLKNLGACAAPFNSFLMIRGAKTFALRMRKHCENAQKVAEYLESHPKINEVRYPGLKSHPQYGLAQKMLNTNGGMICLDLKGGVEQGIKFMESLNLCVLAVSVGDTETLVEHPASMTHWYIPKEEREKGGITDGLIRMSVGLEDPDDIIADIEQALAGI
jgi:Cystathionine beta-lyases/cystathionine gamma-synthases